MPVTNTAAYDGPFELAAASEIPFEIQVATADEVQLLLDGSIVSPSLYEVSLNGDGSGTIEPVSPLTGTAIVALNPSFTQTFEYGRYVPFFPDQLTAPLDEAARRDIYLKSGFDRALKVPFGTTAPAYEEFAAAFKGDPGGNVESVGLFSAVKLGLTAVPAGTDVVRTSGNLVKGVGEGAYGRHADVDEAYVAANPLTSFLTLGINANPGFRLITSWLTPWLFGQPGLYATDRVPTGSSATWDVVASNDAHQALLDYVAVQERKVIGDLRGNWGLLDPDNDDNGLIIDQPRANGQIIIGGTYIALEAMEHMIYAANFRNSEMWGTLGLLGAPTGNFEEITPYADRLAKHGIRLVNCGRSVFNAIKTANTKCHGITDNISGPGNNIHGLIKKVYGIGNGSWPHSAGMYAPDRTFSTRVDSGNDGNPNQESVLGGIADTSDFEVGSYVWSPLLGRRLYIKAKTVATLTVYPWPAHSFTSGTLRPMHGAALALSNNDNTGFLVHQLDAFFSGSAAVVLAGLYGAHIQDVQAQFCSAAVVFGKAIGASGPNICRGGSIDRLHSEGNEEDIVQVSGNGWWDIGEVSVIGHDGDASLFQRCTVLRPRFLATTLSGIENYGYGLSGVIRIGGAIYSGKGSNTGGFSESSGTYVNSADGRPYHIHLTNGANHTINLHADEYLNDKFQGAHSVVIIATGTGSSGQPTGVIIVQPEAAQLATGYTTNSGSSVVISNLSQFAYIVCARRPNTSDWSVVWNGRGILKGSATYDPPSLALGASSPIQTMTITGLALGDEFDSWSLSINAAGARVDAWVSAANTAQYIITNVAGTNPLDLASLTVRIGFRRSS